MLLLLFEALLLVLQTSSGVAFQATTISNIYGPARLAVITSKCVNIDHCNINGEELLIYSRLSTSPASASSTSLSLFGKFGKGKGDNGPDDNNENIEADSDASAKISTISLLKVALPSFIAGGVVTLGFLFLPLLADYNDAFNGGTISAFPTSGGSNKINAASKSLNNVNQPVILFETILNDLNDAYVDKVDVQKLFETGVKAMTASLDPYTEFESRLEAKELEESVTGKYGGVGLVIRGGANLKLLQEDEDNSFREKLIVPGSNIEEIESHSSSGKSISISSPPVAVRQDGGRSNRNDKKISVKDDDVDIDEIERKRARKKSMEDGIRVVSAFEGKVTVLDICVY